MKKYGGILRACRERKGLTQEELALEMNVNQSDISKYESGSKEPTLSIVQAWLSNTQATEVLVAFMCGVDGLNIMQSIMQLLGG
ncbi:helix-turn-helix domain-containing protein [Pseudogracilibacillus auburnensis]|uniref:Helix-turn-helix protein n=2 Tax=Pseudogracilibacillus auburnensis TaxID=1494959 RepID=A0A2V3W508_9BACI|nr:helix-turn-helix transcriptional regulator [Pseudogracilibacillus auburnensis]MBO1005641.1 helix-turn-helix transcriptional regulator [Pseudogracilibacillus auburnensis]PXW88786.1 helix-turn-helix protein [Pseudogracilibacillus auburnensis]